MPQLLIAFVTALLIGCTAAASYTAASYSLVTLSKGFQSGVRERKFVAVKTENEWKALWMVHASTAPPQNGRPAVDFQSEMVVAVFSGEKRTGGYAIEIARIEENTTKHVVEVFVRESKPPPGAVVTQNLTQPYHIIKLARLKLPVTFVFQ